jgi:plastocyanin
VPFDSVGSQQGLAFNGSTSVTVEDSGTYMVDYYLGSSSSSDSFSLEDNGVVVPGGTYGGAPISGVVLVTLTAGDTVTIQNTSGASTTLTAPRSPDVEASLRIVRIADAGAVGATGPTGVT